MTLEEVYAYLAETYKDSTPEKMWKEWQDVSLVKLESLNSKEDLDFARDQYPHDKWEKYCEKASGVSSLPNELFRKIKDLWLKRAFLSNHRYESRSFYEGVIEGMKLQKNIDEEELKNNGDKG